MALLVVAGCESVFGKESGQRGALAGKRENVFSTDRALKPEAELQATPIEVPAPRDGADWPLAGGSLTRFHGNLSLSDSPSRAWSTSIGDGSVDKKAMIAQPVLAEGKIFTVDSSSLVTALNASDGSTLWRKTIPDPYPEDAEISGSGLGYAAGKLVVTTNYGNVTALEGASGRVIWQRLLPAPIRSAPMIDGDRVYVTSTSNVVYDLALSDGSIGWSRSSVEEPAALMGMASPLPAGEVVAVPFSSGQVVGMRKINGGTVWEESLASSKPTEGTLPAMSDIQGEMVSDNGKLYVGSHSGRLIAIDLRSGVRLWETDGGGTGMPWVAGNAVYVITIESQLAAISAEDGRVYWTVDLPRYVDPEDRTDAIIWTSPVLAGSKLWAANSLGELHSFDPRTGKALGTMGLSGPAFVPMLAANRTLYILTDDGTLTAYK